MTELNNEIHEMADDELNAVSGGEKVLVACPAETLSILGVTFVKWDCGGGVSGGGIVKN